jgi:hypothetical protein
MDKLNGFLDFTPLALIHPRISIQVDSLFDFGEEITVIIDKALHNLPAVDPEVTSLALRNIWFWVLGAYEVTRSLHEKGDLFQVETKNKLGSLKKYINKLRVPFAKHQVAGNRNTFIRNEASMMGIDSMEIDFIFLVQNEQFNFKRLFLFFKETYNNIKKTDLNIKAIESFHDKYYPYHSIR